jgi:hypothetical protein
MLQRRAALTRWAAEGKPIAACTTVCGRMHSP